MADRTLFALRPEDVHRLRAPGEPHLSADARSLAYVVAWPDERRDAYRADLHIVRLGDRAGRTALVVRGRGRIRRPLFSPTRSCLAFTDADTEGRDQIWLLDLQTGVRRQLTTGPGVRDLCWSPDGSRIAYCAPRRGMEPGSPRIRRFIRPPVAAEGLGILESEGAALLILDVGTGTSRQVAGGAYTFRRPAWSPDGRYIACGRLRHHDIAGSGGGELVVIRATGGDCRILAHGLGWTPAPMLAWSPDAAHVAYWSSDLHVSGRPARLWQVRADGSEARSLNDGHDRGPSFVASDTRTGAGDPGVAYSADGALVYYLAADHGAVQLFACASDSSGRWSRITRRDRECVAEFAVSGRTIAFVAQRDDEPDRVWVLQEGQGPWPVTSDGMDLWQSVSVVQMDRFTVRVGDGPDAEGWIMRPASVPRPAAILNIHGGPHSMSGYTLSLQGQLWAQAGWAVIQLNPPGSGGYGFEFARQVWEDWCGRDYDYQMAALDLCARNGWISASRLAVTGMSYGGYMTNRIISRTDRFVCALTENGISDLSSMFGTSDLGVLLARHIGGAPWESPSEYLLRSPLRWVNGVKTPLLLLHGEADRRVPIGQAEEFFTALARAGKTVAFVRYPGEGHLMRFQGRPSSRIDLLRRYQEWFEAHLDPPGRSGR